MYMADLEPNAIVDEYRAAVLLGITPPDLLYLRRIEAIINRRCLVSEVAFPPNDKLSSPHSAVSPRIRPTFQIFTIFGFRQTPCIAFV
jgi:hypothetical protein